MQCPDCHHLRHTGPCVDLIPEGWDPYDGLEQEPSDLELLTMDAERSAERVQEALRKEHNEHAR